MKKRMKMMSLILTAAMVISGSGLTTMAAGSDVSEAQETVVNDASYSIVLGDSEKTLGIGETYTITATTTPEDLYIDWESSNTEVATVDAGTGLITALKEGQTVITAKLSSHTDVTASCTVTVEGTTKLSCGTDIYYTLDKDGVLTISGSGTMTDFYNDWSAPDPGWASNCNDIKKIVVSEGVTAISGAAFGFYFTYPNVTEIEIASSVNTIGQYAFRGCSGLQTITFAGNAPEVMTYGLPSGNFTVKYTKGATGFDGDTWKASNITLEEVISEEELAAIKAKKEATTATVTADAQAEGAYLLVPTSLEVNAYEAESYGFQDDLEDSVSTLDVLVAETKAIFGEDFTADNASGYLFLNSGWITTIFGVQTSAASFYVNDAMTETTVEATPVADGDTVTFFIYQDQTYWSDKYTAFAEGKNVTATEGSDVTLTVQSIGWDGSASAVEEASVGYLTVSGGVDITEIGTTDENGKITFTAPEAGTYQIVAYGSDITDSPLVMNPITLVSKTLISASDVALKYTSATYTGKEKKPAVTVKSGKAVLKKGTDYTVSYKNNVNAGTAKVTVNGIGKYTGTVTKTFTIKKAAQKITASNKTVKRKSLTTSYKLGTKVRGGAKVTYKSYSKSIKVSKSGKVTVKKGIKKGKYKIVIRAAATKNYKSAKKTVYVKVK